MEYEVTRAVILQGVQGPAGPEGRQVSAAHLCPRDIAALAQVSRQCHEWLAPHLSSLRRRRSAAVRAWDDFSEEHGGPGLAVRVSTFKQQRTKAGDNGISPRCVYVYVDEPDAGTLSEICDWLGTVRPRALSFFTFRQMGCNCLTDDMLLRCAGEARLLGIVFCDQITDRAISQLQACRSIHLGNTPGVTPASLRQLPELLHVKYFRHTSSQHGIDDAMLDWLRSRGSSGMLQAVVY
jgi:hypothetical protein